MLLKGAFDQNYSDTVCFRSEFLKQKVYNIRGFELDGTYM